MTRNTTKLKFKRESGILLHPTSLPSKYGIGDFGKEAYDFVDFLFKSKQKLWQVLPLNPVGYGNSPYSCLSAFAGNPLLISIDKLLDQGLLTIPDVEDIPQFSARRVQYSEVKLFKDKVLKKAFHHFQDRGDKTGFNNFIHKHKYWLEDYCLFMALKDHFGGEPWNRWEKSIAFRANDSIEKYKQLLERELQYHQFLQYIFFEQWLQLKRYANVNGIKIIGDLPIYVSFDSSDTWARTGLFHLDESGNPTKVAGVPPDYFSETGQLWGNPIYRWDSMEKDGFRWWVHRFKSLLQLVDIIRIDHFRGFEAYWEVPAKEKTAINGRWVKAPGYKLFATLKAELGNLPFIAEDLGIITPPVKRLKNKFHLPGMKVWQFALESGEEKEFLPDKHQKHLVLYTGTHDNDTILGWYNSAVLTNSNVIKLLKRYFHINPNMDGPEICWRIIEIVFQSNANTVIVPLQDILALGHDARMNFPGTVEGNWEWRFPKGILTPEIENKLSAMAVLYHRV